MVLKAAPPSLALRGIDMTPYDEWKNDYPGYKDPDDQDDGPDPDDARDAQQDADMDKGN